MNRSKEKKGNENGLLKRILLRLYAIPGGLIFGITNTARCRNSNRNKEILHAVEKKNPKVVLEFEYALKGVMITIGCDECGIDEEESAGILMEDHSNLSLFEQTNTSYETEGTGSLFSEHLMTGNQDGGDDGREIKVGGKKEKTNYSPSWPSSLDIGSSGRSLYKGFKTDRSSDEDYIPTERNVKKLTKIKDIPMNLGSNKTSKKTGMGDNKHAGAIEVSATPENANKRENRFRRVPTKETIEETQVTETQVTLPSTVPYGGSSINEALFKAIHQQKNTLRQIHLHCALTQATSLLRSLRPVRPEFCCNVRKHPVLPWLPGHALSILTRRHVVPVPWLRFYSLLSHDGASFTLPLPRALTYFSCHLHRRLVRPSLESHVYRVD